MKGLGFANRVGPSRTGQCLARSYSGCVFVLSHLTATQRTKHQRTTDATRPHHAKDTTAQTYATSTRTPEGRREQIQFLLHISHKNQLIRLHSFTNMSVFFKPSPTTSRDDFFPTIRHVQKSTLKVVIYKCTLSQPPNMFPNAYCICKYIHATSAFFPQGQKKSEYTSTQHKLSTGTNFSRVAADHRCVSKEPDIKCKEEQLHPSKFAVAWLISYFLLH